MYGPDGGFTGYVGIDIDITERKNAEDRTRESRAALEASHREIQHLAGRLIEAQDAERARVARDLHDDVSQQLAGLSIALSGLKRRMDESHVSEDLQADLRALHQRTATLAQNVRHLSHDLHPTVLRHAGLVAALTSYCAELERSHGTVVNCSAEGDFAAIAPEAALCLYRIAQEALRNVIAHAGASRADVRLRRTGDHAEITIADDGKGFDLAGSLEAGQGPGAGQHHGAGPARGRNRQHRGGAGEGNAGARPDPGARLAKSSGSGAEAAVRAPVAMRRTTVLLADDHAIVGEGLARLLREHDFDVVGTVGDGQLLLDAARRLRPDVIVTDLSMPGLSGLDVLARLKADGIDSKVIVLTMHNDADLATDRPARRRLRLPAQGVGRRRAAGRHSPGPAGPRLPHARPDQGRHGAHGRLRGRAGAAAHAAPA